MWSVISTNADMVANVAQIDAPTLMISAGNDGRGAVSQAERIFKGIPFTVASPPQIFRGPASDEHLAAAAETGQALAAGLSMGIF